MSQKCDAKAARECALHILCSVIGKCCSVEVVSKEFRIERDIMRLDKFLKVSRIIKRRTIANEACDGGRVSVNGKTARASYLVKTGDVIEINFGTRCVKIKVERLPYCRMFAINRGNSYTLFFCEFHN